jgi:hypothetical protein
MIEEVKMSLRWRNASLTEVKGVTTWCRSSLTRFSFFGFYVCI